MAQDLNKMMLSTLKKNENNAKRIKVWLDKIMVNFVTSFVVCLIKLPSLPCGIGCRRKKYFDIFKSAIFFSLVQPSLIVE